MPGALHSVREKVARVEIEILEEVPQHGPFVSALLATLGFLVATVAVILKVVLYVAIGVIIFLRVMTKNPDRG